MWRTISSRSEWLPLVLEAAAILDFAAFLCLFGVSALLYPPSFGVMVLHWPNSFHWLTAGLALLHAVLLGGVAASTSVAGPRLGYSAPLASCLAFQLLLAVHMAEGYRPTYLVLLMGALSAALVGALWVGFQWRDRTFGRGMS
jgi:hypothetical protein